MIEDKTDGVTEMRTTKYKTWKITIRWCLHDKNEGRGEQLENEIMFINTSSHSQISEICICMLCHKDIIYYK